MHAYASTSHLAQVHHRGCAGGYQKLGTHRMSEHGQDIALFEQFFGAVRGGTFVEMGALDGVLASNTYAFYKVLNWTGLLMDANPASCEPLRRNRQGAICLCPMAIAKNTSFLEFQTGTYLTTFGHVEDTRSGLSGKATKTLYSGLRAGNRVRVPAMPLSSVLRKYSIKFIDFFSLDCEGSELRTLQTMDWSIPVRVWMIEVQPERSDKNEAAIAALLEQHGYERWYWSKRATPGTRQMATATSECSRWLENRTACGSLGRRVQVFDQLWVRQGEKNKASWPPNGHDSKHWPSGFC